jgi:hypothetical protein
MTSQEKDVAESTGIELPTRVGQVQRQEPFKETLREPLLNPVKQPAQPERVQARPLRAFPAASQSERADILKRVATFRAHQLKIGKDREKYYEGVQEKIRKSLADQKAKEL